MHNKTNDDMQEETVVENPGIDPGASRMRIERSTIWANSPLPLGGKLSLSHFKHII